jgi:hypothetical protein
MHRTPWSCGAGALILALVVSHPAAAQAPAPSPAAAAAPTTSLAPTLAAIRLGISAEDPAPLMVNASAARAGAHWAGMTRERSSEPLADDDQRNAEFVARGSCACS